ncbi:MAG: hypothetical protein F4066_03710 [Chloroflexi bacterium]|nr:hypothetical protein [Chloroflexota bacterium]MYF81223.1 hypothetical protein [Chloroflexota bacterium]MYI03948.1 hypothetical protein [Chloroflexota bacterium]
MRERPPSGDWQSLLARWQDAGLVDDEHAERIRSWEASNAPSRHAGRLVDALSYFGGAIMLAGALMAVALTEGDGDALLALPFLLGLASGGMAWAAARLDLRAFADCVAGSSIVLVAVGLTLLLDEIGGDGPESVGFLLVCFCVAVVGGWFARSMRSPIATTLSAAAIVAAPFAIAVEGRAFDAGIFGGYREIDEWSLWVAFTLVVLVGGGLLWLLLRVARWEASDLSIWARLGATAAGAIGLLGLAGASSEPVMDWMSMLAGVVITASAFRHQRIELLPASALLILGSIAGGLSDFHSDARIALSLLILALLLQATVMSGAWSQRLGPLADHWLTPVWWGALLLGGVVVASFFAAEGGWLAVFGIVWGLALLVAGVVKRSWIEVLFGALGVYVPGLLLIVDDDIGTVGVVGTILFGLAIVIGGVIWQRREWASRIDTARG